MEFNGNKYKLLLLAPKLIVQEGIQKQHLEYGSLEVLWIIVQL